MELFITIVGSEYLFDKQTAPYPVTYLRGSMMMR